MDSNLGDDDSYDEDELLQAALNLENQLQYQSHPGHGVAAAAQNQHTSLPRDPSKSLEGAMENLCDDELGGFVSNESQHCTGQLAGTTVIGGVSAERARLSSNGIPGGSGLTQQSQQVESTQSDCHDQIQASVRSLRSHHHFSEEFAQERCCESASGQQPVPRKSVVSKSRADGDASPVEIFLQRLEDLYCIDRAASHNGREDAREAAHGRKSGRLDTDAVRHSSSVNGTDIHFPFPDGPMLPQRQVMERVIEALDLRCHAVLESPTGTGKTAAALCAALAWQQKKRIELGWAPQLVYVSRTHAQLRQVVAELKRTPYRPAMVVIGSRECGLCVHPRVSGESENRVRQACRDARRAKDCTFHNRLREGDFAEQGLTRLQSGDAWDIEDIAAFGRESGGCAYYMAHGLARYAELILCPYSYIFDPSVRRAAGASTMDLKGRVVIVDEAHNIEGVCRDAGSAELSLDHMRAALGALKRSLDGNKDNSGVDTEFHSRGCTDGAVESLTSKRHTNKDHGGVRKPAASTKDELGGFLIPSYSAPSLSSREIRSSHERTNAAGVPQLQSYHQVPAQMARQVRGLIAFLSRICSFVSEAREAIIFAPHGQAHRQVSALFKQLKLDSEPSLRYQEDGTDTPPRNRSLTSKTRGEVLLRELISRGCGGPGVAPVLEMTSSLFAQLAAAVTLPGLYVVRIDPVDTKGLTLWLMSAEGTLAPLAEDLHSLVLMSGTLAPLQATVAELGSTFGRRVLAPVEAGHVVASRALKFIATGHVDSTKLECTYHAWKRETFLLAVGNAILTVIRNIPGGVLVFLPSYDLLDRCMQAWQSSGNAKKKRRGAVQRVSDMSASAIWEQLLAEKETIVFEPAPMPDNSLPKASAAYESAKYEYERAIQRSGRAMLLAVYRGRMSEGVSFDDDYARGVICVGIPFPNLKEERLVQKRACNDFWLAQRQNSVSGDLWYECRALQAVAQALGRCIRHPNDYGALVLLDSRWVELGKVAGLPHWLQHFFEDKPTVAELAGTLQEHFRNNSLCTSRRVFEAEQACSVRYIRSVPAGSTSDVGKQAMLKMEEHKEHDVGIKKELEDELEAKKEEEDKSEMKLEDEEHKLEVKVESEKDEIVAMPAVWQRSVAATSHPQTERATDVFRQSLKGRKRLSATCIDLE